MSSTSKIEQQLRKRKHTDLVCRSSSPTMASPNNDDQGQGKEKETKRKKDCDTGQEIKSVGKMSCLIFHQGIYIVIK